MTGIRTNIASVLALALLFALCLAPSTAFADSVEQLSAAYADALRGYEDALDEKEQNADAIAQTEAAIVQTEQLRDQAQGELDETIVTLYKDTSKKNVLLDLIMGSESFQDAVIRYDLYEKVERRCYERVQELVAQCDELTTQKIGLEVQKTEIEARVEKAYKEAEKAEEALLQAKHMDGDEYHQVQGNGSNCGATAFIVGVNILLNEERYDDNVEVWEGPGFNGDSTNALAARGEKWLEEEELDEDIGIEEVEGDIHDTDELRELLEDGAVVVISSGSGSEWHYANNPDKGYHKYPDGHWVVFYYYDPDGDDDDDEEDADEDDEDSEGVFYCNDSAVSAKKGAGCPYTEEQMQDWLDGRENHFATVLYLK